jgi:hypothetical protein
MNAEDTQQVKDIVAQAVSAGIASYDNLAKMRSASEKPATSPVPFSRQEVGSPEFAEDRTQVNSLNNKWIFESAMDRYYSRSARSDDHFADLQSRGLDALTESLNLTKQVHSKFFTDMDDRARIRDGWNYNTAYDLANPNTLGTSDNVRGGVVPQNRAIDTATAQSTLNNTTLQTAILGAVADAMNGTIPTLEAAIGAAVAAALANTPTVPKA